MYGMIYYKLLHSNQSINADVPTEQFGRLTVELINKFPQAVNINKVLFTHNTRRRTSRTMLQNNISPN